MTIVSNPKPPLHTLIADASEAFTLVLERWIASRPDVAWVATVRTGPDAIDAARRLTPDLVLIDAVLPGFDGLRVVRELRRLPRPPLVVVVTFQADPNVRRAASDAGASAFVAKDQFAAEMDRLLPELVASVLGRDQADANREPNERRDVVEA